MTAATLTRRRAELPPQRQVLRQAPFGLRDTGDEGQSNDGQTLDGYAAVFNTKTIIDSWEGRFWEQIASGSMKKSFRESPPLIQFDHGHHPLVGSIPIAELTSVSEEVDTELAPDGGAHVIGRMLDNWMVQPVRDAIAAKAIKGMSFRFSVVNEQWADADGKVIKDEEKLRDLLFRSWYEDIPDDELLTRTLKELRVPELGPVVWPAYEATSVGVRNRSQVIDLGRLTDPAQRKLLAEAVLMADAAERAERTEDNKPPSNTDTTDASQTNDGPEVTAPVANVAAGNHPSEVNDSPRSTDVSSAGEHESTPPPRGQRPVDKWVNYARGVVLPFDEKGNKP